MYSQTQRFKISQTLFGAVIVLFSSQMQAQTTPQVSVHATDFLAEEGNNTAAFTLTRSGNLTTSTTVNYSISGTAQNGVDYKQISLQATFATNQERLNIIVNPIFDSIIDDKESVILTLLSNSSYTLNKAVDSVIIRDKDFIGEGIVAPLSETFNLNSLPGADVTLYINFNGGVYSPSISLLPFSMDSDTSTFSNEELFQMQRIFECVAEDFRPFNVNVTTIEPTLDMIVKSDSADEIYGGEVMIGNNPTGQAGLAGGGIASASSAPGFWNSGSDGKAWGIYAAGASHEFGHMFGLGHDADSNQTNGYYYGHQGGWGAWNAIMGASTWAAPSQWSKGEYNGALNQEDDIAIIAGKSHGFRVDDHADTANFATELSALDNSFSTLYGEGIIETSDDSDWFFFYHEGGSLAFRVDPINVIEKRRLSPNLDISASLYDSAGNLIQENGAGEDFLWAHIFNDTLPAGTYYLKVEGTGSPYIDYQQQGYTDYGSLGAYKVRKDYGSLVRFENLLSTTTNLNSFSADSDIPSDIDVSVINPANIGNYVHNGELHLVGWDAYDTINITQEYLGFTITPDTGITLDLSRFQAWMGVWSTLPPANWALRSSLDNFATNVDIQPVISGRNFPVEFDLSSLPIIDSTIEFRLFIYRTPATNQSPNWLFVTLTPYEGYAWDQSLGIQVIGYVGRQSAPITSDISLCQGESSSALSANASLGYSLVWYDTDSTTVLSSAPVPSTATAGSTTYFVAQQNSSTGHITAKSPITVTVNAQSTFTDTILACSSYTWIDGNTYTASNNTATYTLTNAAGCDSVVTLDLTINSSNTGTDVITACDSYTWIDGLTYTSSNNSATYTLTNAAGCDSVVTLNLTINSSNTGTDVITACDSYTWIDGNTYTASNNTATYTLTNVNGCDSVVTLDLTINSSNTGTDVITACDTYTWIDGNTYTASNNTATYTLTNAAGCDSVVTLNLTINSSNTGTDVITACDSYTWIDGNTYTASNNSATYTLTNVNGCDSVVTLDLTINSSNTGTDVITACDSYTWIDGNTYTTSNNTATYTLTNAAGCDSVVTLDLTINSSNTGTDVITACDSYTWIDGNTYTASNNTATYTLTNVNGCDSVVTLNLTINSSNTGIDVITACDSYTWIDGNTYTASNNTATHTLTNVNGCDSVVTLDLTINSSNTGTDVITACDSYTWIDGNTYTASNNTATYTLTNASGCDSVVTLDLTIESIDATVTLSGLTIYALSGYDAYQWYECTANGLVVLNNETNDSIVITANGDYAVVINNNNCSDTSDCMTINNVGFRENNKGSFRLFPNPTQGVVKIERNNSASPIGIYQLQLVDSHGKMIQNSQVNFQDGFIVINLDNYPAGVYQLTLMNQHEVFHEKVSIVN